MLRVIGNGLSESSRQIFGANPQSLQFLRWRRKPRWLPVAKTKMFRIPERPTYKPGEAEEIRRLHNNYRTQMRSVRLFFREEVQRVKATSTADHLVVTPEEEEAEYLRLVAENKAWNAKIAEERNERLRQQFDERKQHISERLELAKERAEDQRQRADQIVRLEKARAKTFITRESLDSAIEHALANPIDYNFALDAERRMYKGRESKTPEDEPAEEKALSTN